LVVYRLLEVRNEKNISTRELARISGVARSHIEKIEAGTANPSVEVMCKLSKALQVPFGNLVQCDHEVRSRQGKH
jgi:transcriptional regulator with XRE-family HTH domain